MLTILYNISKHTMFPFQGVCSETSCKYHRVQFNAPQCRAATKPNKIKEYTAQAERVELQVPNCHGQCVIQYSFGFYSKIILFSHHSLLSPCFFKNHASLNAWHYFVIAQTLNDGWCTVVSLKTTRVIVTWLRVRNHWSVSRSALHPSRISRVTQIC